MLQRLAKIGFVIVISRNTFIHYLRFKYIMETQREIMINNYNKSECTTNPAIPV